MKFLVKLLLAAVAAILASYILPGVSVDNFLNAILLVALLALLNATIKPILVILTIPITILSLGLFLLVINALIILLADVILPGFSVNSFWWALLFSLILSIIISIFDSLQSDNN